MNYCVDYPDTGETDSSEPGQAAPALARSKLNTDNYKDLIDFIKAEPTLARQIIFAANAAIHGHRSSRITSVDRAVLMLGVDQVEAIAKKCAFEETLDRDARYQGQVAA
jgi:HD-like signal output (HDOD) protein